MTLVITHLITFLYSVVVVDACRLILAYHVQSIPEADRGRGKEYGRGSSGFGQERPGLGISS